MKGKKLLSLFVLMLALRPLHDVNADVFVEPTDPTVYLINGTIGVATSADSASIDLQPAVLAVVENKNLFLAATVAADGEHSAETPSGSVLFDTQDLLSGESYQDEYVEVTANEADWGHAGLVVTDSDKYVSYQITGYGYATSLPKNTEWWNYGSLSWSSNPAWGFYTAIRVKKPYKIYLPTVIK